MMCKGHVTGGQRQRGARPSRRSATQLNNAICAAAESGTEQLLLFVQKKLPEMNLVNVSTALHRLARLETETNGELCAVATHGNDPRCRDLLASAKSKIFFAGAEAKARCLSSIAWSCARLRVNDNELMDKIGELALGQFDEFKPFELVILLWSFVRLEFHHTRLFSESSTHILAHMDDYSAACLATAVWSFAKAPIQSYTHICRKAADAFAERLEANPDSKDISPVALENVIWGIATLQIRPKPKTMQAILRAVLLHLKDFKVHEFTITLWASARLGECNERLFISAAGLVTSLPKIKKNMHAQGIANLFWAFAKYAEKGDVATFHRVAMHLLPTCLNLLHECKPQEVSCILSALSKLGKNLGEDDQIDKIFNYIAASACTETFDSFFAGLSLKSIVAILGAVIRVTGNQQSLQDPYSAFVAKLICLCAYHVDDLDQVNMCIILDAASSLPYRTQEVLHAVAIMSQSFSDIGHSDALAPGMLACGATGLTEMNEQAKTSAEISEETSWHALLQPSVDDDLAVIDWHGDNMLAANPALLPDVATIPLEPVYLKRDGNSILQLTMSSSDVNKFEGISHESIGGLFDALALTTFSGPSQFLTKPVSLSVLDEFSGAATSTLRAVTIAFEVNSPDAYRMYNVNIKLHRGGKMYESLIIPVEAGWSIPNTQALELQDLQDGSYETRFTVTGVDRSIQSDTVVHRFAVKQGTIAGACEQTDMDDGTAERVRWMKCERTVTASTTCSGSDSEGASSEEPTQWCNLQPPYRA
jgi:hypothetical protein